ncbi:MAG: bifunctional 2-polyprenyl-6-hydroxyphenol methylase/3-demethylubiquinol 3-O-methyltransferase UbiG [Pseudomonadales bacterium]
MNGTVDRSEIARFDQLADTWWDPGGPMWPLHRLNDLRVPFIVDQLAGLKAADADRADLRGLSVLDIGCAAGLLSEAMARLGADVTGVDPSARNIEIARRHAARAGLAIRYLNGTAEDLAGSAYDVVLNMEVVEHVDDLAGFVAQCCRLTRPGGVQVLATINRTPLSFISAIVGAEYVLRWLPRGTHRWRRFVKPTELESLLHNEDCELIGRSGVAVNPLTRLFRLTPFEGINYMLAARRGLDAHRG